MIWALLVGLTLTSGVSAMTMTDDAMMMKNDTMMSEKMVMKDTVNMSKMSVAALAKHHGYNWSRDRKMLAEKAGIENYRGNVKQNLIIKSYLMSMKKDMMTTEDTMMKKDTEMMKDDKMMKKDTMMMDDKAMMKEAGMYSPYSATAVSASLASGKGVYLFFHATWCPGCRALDSSISGDIASIPAGSVIYKVDYDTNEALRQQYGVTSQHTVVKLNADGTSMKKTMGPKNVMDIVK
jgi:thioredoxin 1